MASIALSEANVCIVGATSTIARHVAAGLAHRGATLHLAARNEKEVARVGRDLRVRYEADISWSCFEVTSSHSQKVLLENAASEMGDLDVIFVAVGMLGNQEKIEMDIDCLKNVININFTAVSQLLLRAGRHFEAQESGMVVALSSVAGDRGRPGNYAYGSAKAGLSVFLEGLRGRLYEHGAHVLTVKLGPTDTKMTFGMDSPPPLMATPERVANHILKAMEKRRDVCYAPSMWRYIMAGIRLIPASLFKKIDL